MRFKACVWSFFRPSSWSLGLGLGLGAYLGIPTTAVGVIAFDHGVRNLVCCRVFGAAGNPEPQTVKGLRVEGVSRKLGFIKQCALWVWA